MFSSDNSSSSDCDLSRAEFGQILRDLPEDELEYLISQTSSIVDETPSTVPAKNDQCPGNTNQSRTKRNNVKSLDQVCSSGKSDYKDKLSQKPKPERMVSYQLEGRGPQWVTSKKDYTRGKYDF